MAKGLDMENGAKGSRMAKHRLQNAESKMQNTERKK